MMKHLKKGMEMALITYYPDRHSCPSPLYPQTLFQTFNISSLIHDGNVLELLTSTVISLSCSNSLKNISNKSTQGYMDVLVTILSIEQ